MFISHSGFNNEASSLKSIVRGQTIRHIYYGVYSPIEHQFVCRLRFLAALLNVSLCKSATIVLTLTLSLLVLGAVLGRIRHGLLLYFRLI